MRLWCVRICLLAFLAVLILTACSFSTPTNIPTHQTYIFEPNLTGLAAQQWHPGDKLPVRWVIKPDTVTTASSAIPYTLTASLVGPVASKWEAINQVIMLKWLDSGRIGTNDWTSHLPDGTLKIPLNAQPGQYAIVQVIDNGGGQLYAPIMIRVAQK